MESIRQIPKMVTKHDWKVGWGDECNEKLRHKETARILKRMSNYCYSFAVVIKSQDLINWKWGGVKLQCPPESSEHKNASGQTSLSERARVQRAFSKHYTWVMLLKLGVAVNVNHKGCLESSCNSVGIKIWCVKINMRNIFWQRTNRFVNLVRPP